MWQFLKGLFSSDQFFPHRVCYLNQPEIIWLNAISDLLIGFSYVAISATLVYLVRRGRRNIPFHWVFLAFGVFIVACGGTHFMEVWTVWNPAYWLAGGVKVMTAVASVATALVLPPLVPKVLLLVQNARVSEERKRKLEAAHQEMATLYEKLKELDELKTQFFANVSHELRTPLTLVLGPTERMLAAENLAEHQRHDLEVIHRNACTLLKHVNDLLDISKLEAGKIEVDYAETDLARLLRLTASHFDALAEERQIAYAVETPEALSAQVDPEKLQRVFLNLLSNAFKFTPASGRVRCTLCLADESPTATIAIGDSGPGVKPELRGTIFERFRQGDGGSTRCFGGTGLGLSIAKEFIELHGGKIVVGEAPEGGALFTITLPLRAPAGVEVRPAPAKSQAVDDLFTRQIVEELRLRVEATPAMQGAGQALVLVVEDNREMNRFVAETLNGEYKIATAFDGKEGLERALALRPDLILSDVMMPQMSGDQLVRELRAHAELEAVPIVLLTAKADDALRVKLLREGAQDYVMKPFSAEELRARVGNLVTIKRAREVLQRELASQLKDLEKLASEVTFRKRELQMALEAMRVARDHAERTSQAKSDFLRLISHELRTPLTSIIGYLYVLQSAYTDTLAPKQREILEKIAGSSLRLQELIESLLEYARLQSGRLLINVEQFDSSALAREIVEELRPQAERKHLELRFQPAAEVPPLKSDQRLVRLMLVNLVVNAIKYTEQGAVEVSVQHTQGAHRLAVTDSGPGIPADKQAVIFDPFEQLEPVLLKHTPGVGLGLALVKQMVTALNGQIELTSRIGVGSTFTVILPPVGEEIRRMSEEE